MSKKYSSDSDSVPVYSSNTGTTSGMIHNIAEQYYQGDYICKNDDRSLLGLDSHDRQLANKKERSNDEHPSRCDERDE